MSAVEERTKATTTNRYLKGFLVVVVADVPSFYFETESHYFSWAGVELRTLPPQPLEY